MAEVRRNEAEARYEGWVDGELAGFAEYRLVDGRVVFTHTEVADRFEGQGVGSAIVRFALDEVGADGTRQVVPLCPFVKGWIEHHPAYADLLDAPAADPIGG